MHRLLVLLLLAVAASQSAQADSTEALRVAHARGAVLERSIQLPSGIDVAALREQLREGYAAEVDRAGHVIITTRKRDLVDRIEIELRQRQLVARFYRTGAAVNPKYAARELDGVLKAAEYYAGRLRSSQGSAKKNDDGRARPPSNTAPPNGTPPTPPRVPLPADDGGRWPI